MPLLLGLRAFEAVTPPDDQRHLCPRRRRAPRPRQPLGYAGEQDQPLQAPDRVVIRGPDPRRRPQQPASVPGDEIVLVQEFSDFAEHVVVHRGGQVGVPHGARTRQPTSGEQVEFVAPSVAPALPVFRHEQSAYVQLEVFTRTGEKIPRRR